MPAISEVLEDFSKEELLKKVFSVEFTRFFNYYKNAKDLNTSAESDFDNSDSIRFFINVGSKDGFDWMRLKDFLKELLQLGKEDLFKVDVKDSFSFFNTDSKHREMVFEVFKNFKLNGRNINVEESQDTHSGRNRGRKGDRRKSGNEFKRRKSSPQFSERREGRSRRREKPTVPGTGGKRRRK